MVIDASQNNVPSPMFHASLFKYRSTKMRGLFGRSLWEVCFAKVKSSSLTSVKVGHAQKKHNLDLYWQMIYIWILSPLEQQQTWIFKTAEDFPMETNNGQNHLPPPHPITSCGGSVSPTMPHVKANLHTWITLTNLRQITAILPSHHYQSCIYIYILYTHVM